MPFFFICSGYFLFYKLDCKIKKEERVNVYLNYIKRIGIIYLTWTTIYTPYVFYKLYQNNSLNIISIFKYIISIFTRGSYHHLWYLLALIYAVLIIYLLSEKLNFKINRIMRISIYMYLFLVLISTYNGFSINIPIIRELSIIYYLIFGSVRHGVIFGFCYVSIGAYLYKKKYVNLKINIVLLLILYLLMSLEIVNVNRYKSILPKEMDICFMLIPTSIFIFRLAQNINFNNDKIAKKLRNLSVLIYTSHMLIIIILGFILKYIRWNWIINNNINYFIVVMTLTVLFSLNIMYLREKKMLNI